MPTPDTTATLDLFLRSVSLLFVLLNPFIMSMYLLDILRDLPLRTFSQVLARGGAIAGVAFAGFALLGERIFSDYLQVRFASFLIFGGIIFLIIGIKLVFVGTGSLEQLRGKPEHLAGSIAMPYMIGPGTVSASVLTGGRLDGHLAVLAIAVAMVLAVVSLIVVKWLHDYVLKKSEAILERYIDIIGRISSLIIGTIAVEMLLQGVDMWLTRLPIAVE